jgi:hypothetical protein
MIFDYEQLEPSACRDYAIAGAQGAFNGLAIGEFSVG